MPACAGMTNKWLSNPLPFMGTRIHEIDVDGAAIRGFAPKGNKGGQP
jgi:hypothetical protein